MDVATRSPLIGVLLAVIGVLTVASLIGAWLARRAAGEPSPVVENLNARVRAWWVMVAALGGACLLGRGGVTALFALCSLAALREFTVLVGHAAPSASTVPTAPRTRRPDRPALLAAFLLVLPLQYGFVYVGWYGLYAIFIPVYAFLLLPMLALLRSDTSDYLARVAETQWGLMIAVFAASHLPALLTLSLPGDEARTPGSAGLLLLVWLILTVQFSDVLQYTVGKLAGRRKIAPALSPSKTVEGTIGGIALAVALGASLYTLTPFPPLAAAALALIATLMGFLGGLVLSAIKRDRGVKDWGSAIAGHGGFIDRLDSLLFAAPVVFHLTRFGWADG